nr:small ribosomal subunit Rsm22 family protein [Bryobacter sp.]
MQLPPDLRARIEALIADVPPAALARAAETLSAHYRDHQPTAALRLTAEEWTAAYLATRLPATYAAAHRVFHELADHAAPASLLDLGAGCGAASLAARAVWPNLSTLTLIEHDRSMLRAGQSLLPHASWLRDDLRTALFPAHDLVVACYALNELPAAQRDAVLLRAWQAARVALVLIEPGSRPGFDGIRSARDSLLSQGAHLAAPCPSESPCPMAAPDWCHFAARVER